MKRKVKRQVRKLLLLIIVLIIGFFYSKFENNNVSKENSNSVQNVVQEEKSLMVKDQILNVYYFNVGQADAILLELSDHYMMIDAGNNVDGPLLVNFMKNVGVEKIDYLVATHAHEDHIGGIDNIIDSFEINKFYMPDVVTTTKTFEDVIVSLENKNIGIDVPEIGELFNFGQMKFEVLYLSNDDSDLNETSIVLRGIYGNNSFLFMGDATNNCERVIMSNKSIIDSDVLKVGHHGSKYSSSIDFLKKVTPEYAIISTGVGNSYEHPHDEAIVRLEKIGAEIYRTDINGTIVVSSDGKSISVNTIKTELDG